MIEKTVAVESEEMTAALFGTCDKYVKQIEARLGVHIRNTQHPTGGDALAVSADSEDAAKKAVRVLEYLMRMVRSNGGLTDQSVEYILSLVVEGEDAILAEWDSDDVVCITMRGKPIKPRTVGQRQYVQAIRRNTVIFGIGPAGTGKTFLAVAMAVDALRQKQVERIILTRPAVEAGEKLGFLPGDLQNKIDPYLRPLNDALFEMLGPDNYTRLVEKNAIEIAPLAYMRGRTLENSFIILDEAQNTTPEQMKMFLTRLGNGSRVIVTGDPTQTDLPYGKKSGLAVAVKILKGIDDICIHTFTERDVVRHRLVQKIILAYDKYEREAVRASQERYAVHRVQKRTSHESRS